MRIEHSLPPGFLDPRPIRVLVVGAGGTGSAVLLGLPYLDQAMRVWGHPYGLQVLMMDADTVSETNCVRQPFSASDIGQNKATVLINRINMFWVRSGQRNRLSSTKVLCADHITRFRICLSVVSTPAPHARSSIRR